MKIINWQCQFTAHQFDTWNALQGLIDEPILYVIARLEDDVRKEQGWKSVDTSGLKVIMFEGDNWLSKGINIIRQNIDAIHVFGGFWADRRFFPLIVYALWIGARVVVMNEAYSTDSSGYFNDNSKNSGWFKAQLRPWLYMGVSRILNFVGGKNKICILAISHAAVNQFIRAGFDNNCIFPFGYFVKKIERNIVNKKSLHENLKVIYVGSLLKRKGIDFALKTISSLLYDNNVDIQIDVFGFGNIDLIKKYLSDKLNYKGVIHFGQAQEVIADYDILLLPSRHDGWGVVVNESLLQGVPVIVSDHVGASCLVEASGAGYVFKSEDAESLKAILLHLASSPETLDLWCNNAKKISSEITPEKAAKYLLDVLKFFFEGEGQLPKQVWGIGSLPEY